MAQAQHVTPKIEGTAVAPTRVLSTNSITSRTWVSTLFGFLPLLLTWKARLTLAKLSMGEYYPFQHLSSFVRDPVSFGYLPFLIAREKAILDVYCHLIRVSLMSSIPLYWKLAVNMVISHLDAMRRCRTSSLETYCSCFVALCERAIKHMLFSNEWLRELSKQTAQVFVYRQLD